MLDHDSKSYSSDVAAAASQSLEERKYWLAKLSGEIPHSRFPIDKRDELTARRDIKYIEDKISGELYKILLRTSNKSDTRLLMLLLGGLTLLLSRYTSDNDIIVGMPIYKQQVEGNFVNTVLPIRSTLYDDMVFKNLLYQLKQTIADAVIHQNYPLRALMYDLNLPDSEEEFPLFDVALLLDNIQDKKYITHTKPNITFIFQKKEDYIKVTIEYNAAYYDEETTIQILNHYIHILQHAMSNVNKPLLQIDYLSTNEKTILIDKFNTTDLDDTEWKNKTMNQLFEEQVEKTPEDISLIYEGNTLTYKEFNENSNKLARILKEEGVRTDDIIAILMEPSTWMVIAIMAVLKVGAAYLPIDQEIPMERKKFILADSQPSLILCDETSEKDTSKLINPVDIPTIEINNDEILTQIKDDTNLNISILPKHLAYIIYTSGSTGNPKGVMVEHRQVVNTLVTRKQSYKMTREHCALNLFSYAFDGFVTSFFTPLISGTKIVLLSKQTIEDISKIIATIYTYKVTHFISVPVLYQALISNMKEEQASSLQIVTLAGDKVPTNLLEITVTKNERIEIVNEYGITEAAVMSTIYRHQEKDHQIKIGHPITNNSIYITQPGNPTQLKPIRVEGEIFIAGAGVTRGYMNSPTLTSEKYSKNPYKPGQRLLKTGDIAKWLPDGNLEFASRKDFQVKIRGFRIELGEIEYHLLNHRAIKECLVLANENNNGEKYICAYLVGDHELEVSELREHLSRRLPDYMVPAYFVFIDHLPLSPNGKIDRKALPEPEISTTTATYIAPRNEIEKKLVKIWAEILGLQEDAISIEANFFELGGHSLTATILSNQIHKILNTKIPMLEIFKAPFIKNMAVFIQTDKGEKFIAINPVEEKEYYSLSSAQNRLFILQQLDLNATPYNVFQTVELIGKVSRTKIETAFITMIYRHDSLRTSFELIEGESVQIIKQKEEINFKLDYFDMSSSTGIDSKPVQEIVNHFVRPFNLSYPPLIRVGLIKLHDSSHILLVDMHHIITDGVSNGVLLDDFLSLYYNKSFSSLKLQYKDYSHWQQSKEGKDILKMQKEYWNKEFSEEIPILNLPYDNPRPTIQSFSGKIMTFQINSQEAKAMSRIAKTQDGTLFMSLLGAYYILLSKLSGQKDLVVGTPIAGRSHADLEPIIGIFINMLALKNKINPEQSFIQLLQRLKQKTLDAFENQDYQFDDLIENLKLEKDTSRHPLFDVMIVLQNVYDVPAAKSEPKETELTIKHIAHEHRTSQYDMTFTAVEQNDKSLYVEVEFCTALFHPSTISRFIRYFKSIISKVTQNPGQKIANIELISVEEKKQILENFNKSHTKHPKEKSLLQLFNQQVETTPHQVALVDIRPEKENTLMPNPIHITYEELKRFTYYLSLKLIQKGISPMKIIGIKADRSIEMISSMLSILKVGAIYLPIDPRHPKERIIYMLNDSRTELLLCTNDEKQEWPVPTIDLVKIFQNKGSKQDIDPALLNKKQVSTSSQNATNPIYVIYTSGSTGKPKGVIAQQRGIIRLVKETNYIEWNYGQMILPTGAIAFDISTFEIWGPLLNGVTSLLVPHSTILDGEKLVDIVIKYRITVLHLIPQLLNQLIEQYPEIFSKLQYFLVGGDLVRPQFVNKVLEINPDVEIIHMYGPTENTTFSTYYPVNKIHELNLPIGKPIANSTAYILDEYNHIVPIGIPGELTVGGDGIALGYLNNPELTAEKFLYLSKINANTSESQKIYKTGDLAQWLPDGNIKFLGRQDHQVKIRGNRIELEEIENRILRHEDIKEAIVIAQIDKNQGQPYLCAYIVPLEEVTITEIREYLTEFLPEYMIPAYFVQLDTLPVNPNGKINRKALPQPEENILKENNEFESPRNEIETLLVKIWGRILGKEKISINDNFFMIGGDSIKAIQIIAQMKKNGYKVDMKDLYQNRKVAELAPHVKKIGRIADQTVISGRIPLTPIQQDFFTTTKIKPNHFNQSILLQTSERYSVEILKKVFTRIQEHHDVLRMTYKFEGDQIVQTNHDLDYPLEIFEFDLRESENPKETFYSTCNNIQASIDMEKGPLMKVVLFHLEAEDRLLIAIHHLVMDGISWQILLEDMATLYFFFKNSQTDKSPELPLKSDSFKYWSQKMYQYAKEEEILKEIPYWKKLENTPIKTLPKDLNPDLTKLKKANQESITFNLDADNTNKLLNETNRAYNTEINDILLTALALAIYRWAGLEKIAINLEGHGREDILGDIDIIRTIGWFTSRYPIILQIPHEPANSPNQNFAQLIKHNKEMLREIPNKGIGFGILRYLVPSENKKSLTFKIEPEISFNFLGEIGQKRKEAESESGIFSISMENTGIPFSPEQSQLFTLDINGVISNGVLKFSFTYNRHQYKESTIENLTDYYKKSLIEIINHCMNKEESEKTLSDYTVSGMEQSELENVYDALGDIFNN